MVNPQARNLTETYTITWQLAGFVLVLVCLRNVGLRKVYCAQESLLNIS